MNIDLLKSLYGDRVLGGTTSLVMMHPDQHRTLFGGVILSSCNGFAGEGYRQLRGTLLFLPQYYSDNLRVGLGLDGAVLSMSDDTLWGQWHKYPS